MHFQTPVNNWTTALIKMPDWALLKSVNDPAILVDGIAKWIAAGRDPKKLLTDYRHHNLDYTFSLDWDDMIAKWRMNFRRFVDATYLREYAQHIRLVEELNEYTDTRMVTDKALLLPRLTSARAAAWVWNNEYRGRTVVVETDEGPVEGDIPNDCRLVLCNSPIGNDVPKEFYQLSRSEDCPLGVHPYTHWVNKQRDPLDFRWHSGRWHYNEQEYGIKVDYAFTECSPYSNTINGWRHPEVMGGDRELLKEGMRAWWLDCQQTPAYQEGRILGPGAWFTSSTSDDQWDYYRLWESELVPLAEIAAEVWRPDVTPEPPDPPVPPPGAECRGAPRVQYQRVYNVIPQNTDVETAVEVFRAAWLDKKQTVGGSYDDAGVGDLDGRVARLYGIPAARRGEFVDWYGEHYPGVAVTFQPMPVVGFSFKAWPTDFRVIIQPFGSRPKYYAQFGFPGHEGVDIRAPLNTPIYSVANGVVSKVTDLRSNGEPSNYGWNVEVDHDYGYSTVYAHLDEGGLPDRGEFVRAGQQIGWSGNTGNTSGAHLHLTLKNSEGQIGWLYNIVDITPFIDALV